MYFEVLNRPVLIYLKNKFHILKRASRILKRLRKCQAAKRELFSLKSFSIQAEMRDETSCMTRSPIC